MITLPQEIQDQIFLHCDWETLEKSRDLQSEYIKNKTKYNNTKEAALNGNLENIKWLRENDYPWNAETFHYAEKHGNSDNIAWLRKNGCPTFDISFFKTTYKAFTNYCIELANN